MVQASWKAALAVLLVAAQAQALGMFDKDSQAPASPPVRLMSRAKEQQLRRCLPAVDDLQLQAMLDDPRLILYTDAEMPGAYQFFDGAFPGVHSPEYNISANGSEPFGNGNLEFPWGAPAGTHRTEGVRSFRFLWLPLDEQGRTLPVVWFRDDRGGYAWRFPVNAVLGEVLTLQGPGGLDYTFELRTRTREFGDWGIDVLRPYRTAPELAERIRALRPEWQANQQLAALVTHLEQSGELPVMKLADRQPSNKPFVQWMGVDTLPPAGDDALIAELLTSTEFTSVQGRIWRQGAKREVYAPTTLASFHVVPANYDAGFIEIDRDSCIRCHETVNQSVDRFNAGRDWYGRVRGSDGIFSFHPFDPSCISYNGYSQSVRMRPAFTQGGIVAEYDPDKHPVEIYHQVPHLRE